ncbi:SCO0930 family lipoprotein [Streptacidiphilus sp. ASG 303]|uniref:SCO0930 family lipoprotein n=1 Tax=Streptacidiphilus sp. ASG 303 TaxID=2896847 RepID=UPI001E63BA21|nr:SCO0930 family lipoprotein [Streptacidiphilus sp. ASG 303]MCD0486365.1 SCO0930 family lipoprotein [Streptacidiphilus sp. ASG 303]
MKNGRNALLAGAVGALLLPLAACGTQGDGSAAQTVKPAAAAAPGSAAPGGATAPATAAPAAVKVSVRQDPRLGPLVQDGSGRTLYRFDKDAPRPSASNCDGACATAWPPVPADGASAGPGLNPSLLGSVTRSDGTRQLTLGGWPLYAYSKDTKPGDTTGQGVGGTWFASAPDGRKAGAPRPALGVLDAPGLGKVLTDRNGMTLYLFTKDTPWPMATACGDACLQKWTPAPPVTAEEARAADIDPALLFTFTRPDGTRQVAVNCWPAYTFKGDTAPGQTNGQGVGGTWFAISKDARNDRGRTVPAAGRASAPAASAPAASAPAYDSGY